MKVLMAALLPIMFAACIVKTFSTGPHLTGTCEGACEHYADCKPDHADEAKARCRAECPEVFSDEDSLRGFESLSCKDTLEYVDGTAPRAARAR